MAAAGVTIAEQYYTQIQAALQCISSPSSLPEVIQQAQDALVRWENEMPDAYVAALVSLVGSTTTSVNHGGEEAATTSTLRLAAILTLKVAIVRRWKDKCRGIVQKNLLSEDVKTFIRQSMLNLLLAGKVDGQSVTNLSSNPNEITNHQIELLQDRPLQMNASSLLSKMARMDLPLKFQFLVPTLIEGMTYSRRTVYQLQQQQATQESHQHQLYQNQITIHRTVLYNSMNCLENILSELSTQRLLVDKKFRNSLALQYLGSVVESGLNPSIRDLDTVFHDNEASVGMIEAVKYATVSSRVVSHMMINSFSKLSAELSLLTDQILEFIHCFLSRWLSLSSNGGKFQGEAMEELLQVHCDLIVTVQKTYPGEFIRYVTPFLTLFHRSLMCSVGSELVANHIIDASYVSANTNVSLSDPQIISFLTFMTNVVGATDSESETATKEVSRFFTPSLVLTLARTLLELMSLYVYPRDDENNFEMVDRALWQADPEEFYHYEMQRSSESDVGSSSQNLFLTMIESPLSGQYLIPWLMELIANIASQRLAAEIEGGISNGIDSHVIAQALPLGPPSIRCSTEGISPAIYLILQWDAIFTAIGLAGCTLERHGFDLRSWCEASLGPLLLLLVGSASPQVGEVLAFIDCQSYSMLQRRLTISAHLISRSTLPICPFFEDGLFGFSRAMRTKFQLLRHCSACWLPCYLMQCRMTCAFASPPSSPWIHYFRSVKVIRRCCMLLLSPYPLHYTS